MRPHRNRRRRVASDPEAAVKGLVAEVKRRNYLSPGPTHPRAARPARAAPAEIIGGAVVPVRHDRLGRAAHRGAGTHGPWSEGSYRASEMLRIPC